jgi:hypothetical protein
MTTPKRDPILAVLHYFETAELPRAEQAFELVREALRKRRLPKTPPVRVAVPAATKKAPPPNNKKKAPAATPAAPLPS